MILGPYNRGTRSIWLQKVQAREELYDKLRELGVDETLIDSMRSVMSNERLRELIEELEKLTDVYHSAQVMFSVFNRPLSVTRYVQWIDKSRTLIEHNLRKAIEAVLDDEYNRVKLEDISIVGMNNFSSIPVNDMNTDISNVPHFSSVLTYHWIEDPNHEYTETCAFDAAMADTGYSADKIIEIAGTLEIEDGLTPKQLRQIYEHANMSYYGVDLEFRVVVSHIPENENNNRSHHEHTVVHIYANEHVIIPVEEVRKTIVNRHNGGVIVAVADDANYSTTMDIKRLMCDSVDEAISKGVELTEGNQCQTISPEFIKQRYCKQVADIKRAFNDDKERCDEKIADGRTRYKKRSAERRNVQDSVGEELRLARERMKADMKAAMVMRKDAERMSQKPVKRQVDAQHVCIYVKTDNLFDGYKAVCETGHIYKSDLNKFAVKKININSKITVYANPDINASLELANAFGVTNYKNQSIMSMGKEQFEAFKLTGWEYSTFNSQVADVFNTMRMGGCIWSSKYVAGPDEVINGVDHYRNYTSVARQGDFYTFDMVDEMIIYEKGEIRMGMYYVKTTDMMMFDGNGLYDYKVVKMGLDNKVIKKRDIKYELRGHECVNGDTMREFIDKVYTIKNDGARKTMVNCVIGSLGSDKISANPVSHIVSSRCDAMYYYNTLDQNKRYINKFATVKSGRGDVELWNVSGTIEKLTSGTDKPIRLAIVQRARAAVWQTMKSVSRWPGATVVRINTDCVYYVRDKRMAMYPVSETPTFDQVRNEDVNHEDRIISDHKPHATRPMYKDPVQEWTIVSDVVSETEYFDANVLLKYNRIFIDGFAGSGKTYAANELIKKLKLRGRRVAVCAFTHVAALLLDGGVTINSLMGIRMDGTLNQKILEKALNSYDAVVFDEGSMIPLKAIEAFNMFPPSVAIYGFGDFRQFPPIENSDIIYRECVAFRTLLGHNMIKMRKQCRANKEFANKCVEYYESDQGGCAETPPDIKVIDGSDLPNYNICYTNERRREINTELIKKYGTPETCVDIKDREFIGYSQVSGKHYAWERFDTAKLRYIIANRETYGPLLFDSRSRSIDANFVIITKYLANSCDGRKQVEYFQHDGVGRFYPDGSQSLGAITRKVRHSIAGGLYYDIDMENCHPSFLLEMCRRFGLETPCLSEYVNARNDVFEMLITDRFDRSFVKTMMLVLINGGYTAYKKYGEHPWIEKYLDELLMIHNEFIKVYPERWAAHMVKRESKNRKYSDKGSFVNMFLLETENDILHIMMSELEVRGHFGPRKNEYVLCFDGIMVPREYGVVEQGVLESIQGVIMERTGYPVSLSVKSMNNTLELPDVIPDVELSIDVSMLNQQVWDEFPHIYEGMPAIANKSTDMFKNNQRYTVAGILDEGLIGSYNANNEFIVPDSKTQRLINTQRRAAKKDIAIKNRYDVLKEFGKKKLNKDMREIVNDRVMEDMIVYDADPNNHLSVFDGQCVRLMIDDVSIVIDMKRFKKMFSPAYATTAHKNQGVTITQPYGIHQWDKLGRHGRYVAITRTDDPHKVSIVGTPTIDTSRFLSAIFELPTTEDVMPIPVSYDYSSWGCDYDEYE